MRPPRFPTKCLSVKRLLDRTMLLDPTYMFATPVLGGQLAIGVTGLFGRSSANVDGTLTTTLGPLLHEFSDPDCNLLLA